MATLTDGTNFTGSYELQQRTGTKFLFDTDAKYVPKDIEFTVTAKSASPAFDGGTLSGSASGTYTNANTSDTNTSGVSVVASAKANRTAVLYNGAVNGWVTKSDNAGTGVNAVTNQALTSETKYITGVTLQKSTSNRTFDITVPNGSSTVKFTFTVDTNGNVVVT